MSSETSPRRGRSLAWRLTLWYAGVFAASSMLAFSVAYFLIVALVRERTDDDLAEDIGEFAQILRKEGLERVEEEMRLDTQGDQAESAFFRLWFRDGSLVLATDLDEFAGLPSPPDSLFESAVGAEPALATLNLPGREHGVRTASGALSNDYLVELGETLENDDEFVAGLLGRFAAPAAGAIVLAMPIGWFMARRALRPVEAVTRTATEIAAGAMDRRVAVRDQGDELMRLAQAFNAMLDRIQSLVGGMREMSDNLAHDLRSPLTRIRAAAEMTLSGDRPDGARSSLAATATEECDRLLEMIDTNLEITEAESGAVRLNRIEIDLAELVGDACELFQTVAEDRKVELIAELPPHCALIADRQRLQRAIANLIDNALKYTPATGRVTVSLSDEGNEVLLAIADTGMGIPYDETTRIFERFYRSDGSRSQPGNGLGLSLSLANARAHGGRISVESIPGRGSTFTLVLPRRPA
jgi:heavy metal sensor kinase